MSAAAHSGHARKSSAPVLFEALRGLPRRPAFLAELVALAAWAVQLLAFIPASRLGGSGGMVWWCSAGGAMPPDGTPGVGLAVSDAPAWMLMSVTMMAPAALPAVRHVSLNSLRWRRPRATLEFLLVYLGLWTAFTAVLLATLSLLRPPPSVSIPVATVLACGWQLTAAKRRALSACHRSVPLPLRGRRATAGVARFALRHGGACVGSCWALMVLMVVGMSVHALLLVGLAPLIWIERRSLRPRHATRRVALALALGGGAALALTFA